PRRQLALDGQAVEHHLAIQVREAEPVIADLGGSCGVQVFYLLSRASWIRSVAGSAPGTRAGAPVAGDLAAHRAAARAGGAATRSGPRTGASRPGGGPAEPAWHPGEPPW